MGEPIASAITELGEPLVVRPASQTEDCRSCSVYFFQGNPPRWVFRYDESWLIVDEKGIIRDKIVVREP